MKSSTFLLLSAFIAAIFGGLMIFAPASAADAFGLASDPEKCILLRWLGVLILGTALLNFLVRNDPPSPTLRAVLVFNGAFHALTLGVDVLTAAQGVLPIGKLVPGLVVHSLFAVGSFFYAARIKSTNRTSADG